MGTLNKKIYILHGWTYSLDKWGEFEKLLKENNFEPVFLKIPGLTEKSDKIWDLDKYSDWLNKYLSKENEKIILLGHSNGGRIAAYFASKHPNKARNLVLIDSAGVYHKDLHIQIKRFVFGGIAQIGKKFTDSDILKKFLYKLAGESDYQKATPNMKKSMVNLIGVSLTEVYKKITTPTLIIWGEDDNITPLSDAVQINKLIKNSKLEIVKDARHSPFFTHPKEVVGILKNDL